MYLTLCKRVSKLCQRVQNNELEIIVYTKAQDEKFTNFDWMIQKLFQNYTFKHFKDLKFIGEENTDDDFIKDDEFLEVRDDIDYTFFKEDAIPEEYREIDYEDLCVYIDPIDSTSNFIKKNFDPVTCLIGLTYKKKPLMGIIHFPIENSESSSTYFNIPTRGIFKFNNFTNEITKVEIEKHDKIGFTSSSTRTHDTMMKAFDLFEDRVLIKSSGLGKKAFLAIINDLIYLAPGKGLGFWDICAGHCLCKEAGGECYYYDGEEVIYTEERTVPKGVAMAASLEKLNIFIKKIAEENITFK